MDREEHAWFNQLYLKHARRLNRLATRILGNENIGQELVQEVFLLMFCKYEKLQDHPNMGGWLTVALKNRIMDYFHSASYQRELPLETAGETGQEDRYEDPLITVLPRGLNKKEQEILVLVYEKQLSYEAIAKQLRISVLNCRARLYRARNHCRDLLQKRGIRG